MSEQVFRHFATQTKKKPMPVSQSQTNTGCKCGLKWHLAYPMKYRKHMRLPADETAARDFGKSFHKYSEDGAKDIEIIDGEVDMFGRIDTDEDPIPQRYIKGLYWVEDWFQKRFEERGIDGVTPFRTEWEIETKAYQVPFFRPWTEWKELKNGKKKLYTHYDYKAENAFSWTCPTCNRTYDDVWVKEMGFIDLAMRAEDGSIEIWDIKSGKYSSWSISTGLRQQYYYKRILEDMGFTVSSIGLLYPYHNKIVQRINKTVKKGTKTDDWDISRMNSQSMKSVGNVVHKMISRLVSTPIEAEYDPYYCGDLCDFASPEHRLCNFETEQDLNVFTPVANNEELIQLVRRLSVEGITL